MGAVTSWFPVVLGLVVVFIVDCVGLGCFLWSWFVWLGFVLLGWCIWCWYLLVGLCCIGVSGLVV